MRTDRLDMCAFTRLAACRLKSPTCARVRQRRLGRGTFILVLCAGLVLGVGGKECDSNDDGVCGADSCREPDFMGVLEHIAPPECLGKMSTYPMDSFKEEGPGFAGNSCEARVFAALSRLQSTTDCSQVAAAGFMNYGLGSTMHYLILQLQRALRDNRPIAFVGEWVYAGCEARDFSCALEPISPCNKTGVPKLDYPRMEAEELPWDMGDFSSCTEWGGRAPGDAAAGKAESRNGLFHFVSTLAGFLFRANAEMRRAAEAARVRIGLPERYLSVHVRNGDFCIAHTVTSDRKQVW